MSTSDLIYVEAEKLDVYTVKALLLEACNERNIHSGKYHEWQRRCEWLEDISVQLIEERAKEEKAA